MTVRTKDGPKDRLYKEKSPLVGKGGLNIATTDEAQITSWWRRWPDAMIGLPIGEIGLFALDFDPRFDADTGEEWTLERLKAEVEAQLGEPLPTSLAVRTPSGGVHVYYRQPREGDLVRNRGCLPTHVDVRGRGGYVCAPPSVILEGDNPGRYRWLHGRQDDEPVDAPARLIEILREPKARADKNVAGDKPAAASPSNVVPIGAGRASRATGEDPGAVAVRKYAIAALGDECRQLAAAPKGERNTQINRRSFVLGQLVGAGALQESVVRSAVQAIVLAMPHDGGDPSGALRSIENGLTAGMAQPRDLSDIEQKARERASRPPRSSAAPRPSNGDEGRQPFRVEGGARSLKPAGDGELDRRLGLFPMTDLGNAERFRERYGQDFRWSPALGWLGWDGKRWAILDQDDKSVPPAVLDKVFETIRAIQNEGGAIAASGCDPDDERTAQLRQFDVRDGGLDRYVMKATGKIDCLLSEKLRGWGRTSEGKGRLEGVAALARPWLAVRAEAFDADPLTVNCLNGTLRFSRVREGERWSAKWTFGPHERGDMISKLAPVIFDRDAACPIYDRTFAWAQKKPEMRRYLHQWGGLSMTGDIGEQILHFWYGLGGNGKSTIMDAWCSALGDYTSTVPIETFLDQGIKKRGDQASPDLARLGGVRLLRTSEPERGGRIASALIKLVTGGEPFPVRYLNRGFFDLLPIFKMTISGNHRLEIADTDNGIWRRVKLIEWPEDINAEPPGADGKPAKDEQLPEKLRAEASGIFNRLVDGVLDWLENGLVQPDAVTTATMQYREESDPLGRFLKLCTRQAPDGRIQSSRLHEVFVAWCTAAGEKPWTNKGLSKAMADKGFKKKASDGMQWLGIELTRDVSDFTDADGRPLPFSVPDEPSRASHPPPDEHDDPFFMP